MKLHNYTPCSFGLLLWKEKGKKNKSVHKIGHKSVSFFSFLFFFFATQWFQVNHFVLTHPVPKSTSEVNCNRMRVPIEAQQHAMLFAIRKPRWQDDQSCRQHSFVSCVDLCCVSKMQNYSGRKLHSFFFLHSLSICLSVFFQASWWASAFFAGCKNDPLFWKHFKLKFKIFLPAAIFLLPLVVLWRRFM